MYRVSMSDLFPFQDIKKNVLLSSCLDVIYVNIYLRSTSKAIADREKKGKDRNRKS